MSAEYTEIEEGKGAAAGRSLLLSCICPGLGELYCGLWGRAAVLLLLRIVIPLFPAVYLYDAAAGALPVLSAAAAMYFFMHLLSAGSAYAAAKTKRDHHYASVETVIASGIGFTAIAALTLAVFFSLFPVKKIMTGELSPMLPEGSRVWCSVRNLSSYQPGIPVLYRQSGIVHTGRVVAVTAGDVVEYHRGRLTVNGDLFEQSPAPYSGRGAVDENIFTEVLPRHEYRIMRSKDSAVTPGITQFIADKDSFIICPDNRINASPVYVKYSEIICRVEGVFPFSVSDSGISFFSGEAVK